MITSDKQYKASKDQLDMLLASSAAGTALDIPEVVHNASKVQLQSLIDNIQADIAEYETLKSTKPEDLPIQSVQDLLLTPIRYRIASHMSVDKFSRVVGVSARQIHRYEADEYGNINASTFTKILEKLDIALDGHISR